MSDRFIGVLYVTTRFSDTSKALLQKAVEVLLRAAASGDGKLLYMFYYEQQESALSSDSSSRAADSLDLAFDDGILEEVKSDWKRVIGDAAVDAAFMCFEDRTGINEEDTDSVNI